MDNVITQSVRESSLSTIRVLAVLGKVLLSCLMAIAAAWMTQLYLADGSIPASSPFLMNGNIFWISLSLGYAFLLSVQLAKALGVYTSSQIDKGASIVGIGLPTLICLLEAVFILGAYAQQTLSSSTSSNAIIYLLGIVLSIFLIYRIIRSFASTKPFLAASLISIVGIGMILLALLAAFLFVIVCVLFSLVIFSVIIKPLFFLFWHAV